MPSTSRDTISSLLDSFSQAGRTRRRRVARFAALKRRLGLPTQGQKSLSDLADALVSGRREASSITIARDLLTVYGAANSEQRAAFFAMLATRFNPDETTLAASWERYQTVGPSALPDLSRAVEAPRQELFRRLNSAPGGTEALVRMRADLLACLKRADTALKAVDADLSHLLQSWFNRGFLTMRSIDWSSPASLLERLIRYEAVHDISSWDELRLRLVPTDRRCFGFFHPAIPDEPLIFVEVGLTNGMPSSIQGILKPERDVIPAQKANTAVFYSISNCQPGLQGVSFGQFLIKQAASDLHRELPRLTRFVTLSPVPGLMSYLEKAVTESADKALVKRLASTAGGGSEVNSTAVRHFLLKHAVAYLTKARLDDGRPIDPVARFHLGAGARLERLNWLADLSSKGFAQSGGVMVNYLYDLRRIEENQETYFKRGSVVTGKPFAMMANALASADRPKR